MNPEGLQVLAERAAGVQGRPDTRLAEVHARITHARRRRQAGVIGAAVVAVVVALTAGIALLALTDTDDTPPAEPAPRPTSTPSVLVEEAPSVRRLTYATGHKIHWGDRTIDVGSKVWGLAATDDGVVYVHDAGRKHGCPYGDVCRTLWFTDGADTFPIGTMTGSLIRGFGVELANAGSTLVWSEADPNDPSQFYPSRLHYVAYDTGRRREVGRFGSERSEILAVLDDYVYWIPGRAWCLDFQRYYASCRRYKGVMRFDVATGVQRRVSWASYRADRGSRERTFVTPFMHEGGVPEPVLSDSLAFVAQGNHLRADDGGGARITARLASTGQVVRFRIPVGYTGQDFYPVVMWLDDDRLVIRADVRGLMVCRVSTARCRGATTGESETGFGGHG